MQTIIIDEDGSSIWADPKERLEEIKTIMFPKLKDIEDQIKKNKMRMYPEKLNFLPSITNWLDAYLRKRPLIRYDYAVQISAEVLQGFANAFFDLLIFIRDYVPEYIANKQTFCAFASISVSTFNYLQNSTDGDIVAIIESLADSFLETNMSGAMGGVVNSAATFNRMKAKDSGYNMEIKNDGDNQKSVNINIFDNDSIKRQLSNMFGGKLIEKNKK